jgi:hypothetical protein
VPLTAVLSAVNGEEYPEFVQGLSSYGSVYSITGTDFSQDEFVELMSDMYIASPGLYQESINNLWLL